MLAFRPSALALVLLALSSCAYAPGSKGFPWDINFSGFVCNQNPTQFIEGVDWSQAKTIDLRIRQGHFSPTYFSLYVGQPYLLNIENADDVDHTFMAFDFFRAIAVAGVGTQGADFKEIKCLAGVTVPPQTKTSLRLVPIRDGTYEFDDESIINSLAMTGGSGGFVSIEPRRRNLKSSLEHSALINYERVFSQREQIKLNGLDSSINPSYTPNSSSKKPSADKNTPQFKPPSKPSKDVKNKRSTDLNSSTRKPSKKPESLDDEKPSKSSQTKTNFVAPEIPQPKKSSSEKRDNYVRDQTQDVSTDLEGGIGAKKTFETVPEVEKASIDPVKNKDVLKSKLPQAKPAEDHFFEGPSADIFSDPPDSVGIRTDTKNNSGDSGEDKNGSSS